MMWAYVLLAILVILAVILFVQKKRENFMGMKFPFNLTEQITKIRDTTPVGTAPSMTFEGDKYVPGYYKITTKFPMLTKRKLRTVDIQA